MLPVVMLNPSWASAERNDPTVLTVNHFARLWGYGGWRGANLYSWRSPSPAEMMRAPGRANPENDQVLKRLIEYAATTRGRVLCAWGNHGDFEGKATRFAREAAARGCSLVCLGTTASGAPKHPLARGLHRISRDQQPVPWVPGG